VNLVGNDQGGWDGIWSTREELRQSSSTTLLESASFDDYFYYYDYTLISCLFEDYVFSKKYG
jgi:hypothetical protein